MSVRHWLWLALSMAWSGLLLGCEGAGRAPHPTPLPAAQATPAAPLAPATRAALAPGGGSNEEVVILEGVIEAVLPGGYRIHGQRVEADPAVDPEGPLPPGIYVTVWGLRRPDGTLQAEAIEVLRRPGAEVEMDGTVEAVLPDGFRINGRQVFVLPSTAVEGVLRPGQVVSLMGFQQPDGSIVADVVLAVDSP